MATTPGGLPYPLGTDFVVDGDDAIHALATALRPTAPNVRDWTVEAAANQSPGAGAGWVLAAAISITAAPASRYLLLGTVVAAVASGAQATSVRFTANGVVIGTEPRSDLDGVGRPATHTKLYGHTGGNLVLQFLINCPTAYTITGAGTALRVVLL